MVDKFICDTCNEELPSQRGLAIHMGRKHRDNSATVDEPARNKFNALVGKAKISAMLNIPLRGMARTYNDPTIALSPAEAADLDGVIQDLLAEVGGDASTLNKIIPLMPYLALLFIGGPIILDKLEKISEARAGLKPKPKNEPEPADGTRPTLSRKDVQPDAD